MPPATASIDLNADLGEGYGAWSMGDDAAMLEVVTTANIACGGHAGDASTMRKAVRAAAQRGVALTAHVSYPDRTGFGRRFLDMTPSELTDLVIVQVGGLAAMARAEGWSVRGIKPHGALYTALSSHREQAGAVLRAAQELSAPEPEPLALLAAPGSVIAQLAPEAGIPVVLEGFTDRVYEDDGTLRSRRLDGAVLTDPQAVADQALSLAREGRARTVEGAHVAVPCRTLCLHGDTPGAVQLARTVRERLEGAGLSVASPL